MLRRYRLFNIFRDMGVANGAISAKRGSGSILKRLNSGRLQGRNADDGIDSELAISELL